MTNGANENNAGREEIRSMLDEQQRSEREIVGGPYNNSEEKPDQLETDHARERANLEVRLDLLPPKVGEFATLHDFARATEPMMSEERAAGRVEVLAMVDASLQADLRYWAADWMDDSDLALSEKNHKELRADVEHRIAEHQPWRGEFATLDAFTAATDHLAGARPDITIEARQQPEATAEAITTAAAATAATEPLQAAYHAVPEQLAAHEQAAEIGAAQPVRGFFSLAGAAENAAEAMGRAVDIALGAVIGFFVDEPKLTGPQVHDILQSGGNVETIHAREVAAAGYVDAAEHETRMLGMKAEQQSNDVRLADTLGGNATAEATVDVDQQVSERRLTLSR
jgi:hypothetical protein